METIQILVKTMSTVKRLSNLATELLIRYVMDKYPNSDSTSDAVRVRIFATFLYGKDGGRVYRQNLLKMIITHSNQCNDVNDILDELTSVETGNTAFSRKPRQTGISTVDGL